MGTERFVEWSAEIVGDADFSTRDSNADVVVRFKDRREYVATFFTVENLRQLMLKFRHSGENAHGLYVWSTQMIVVDALTLEVVNRVVDDLLRRGDFDTAFARVQVDPEPTRYD
jgi:hypothetical protein